MYLGRLEQLTIGEERRASMKRYYEQGDPAFLPIFLTAGIGDAILSIGALARLKRDGYNLLVYSHHAEALRHICTEIPIHKGDLPGFTWCLHMDSVCKFKFTNRFRGFAERAHQELFDQQQALFRERPQLEGLIQKHPINKFVFTRYAKELGFTATTSALFSLGFKDCRPARPLDHKSAKRYITIHDGYDLNNLHSVSGRATKQWKWTHWNDLVVKLHRAHPTIAIIQIGSKTARVIDGVDENLINKTTLPEVFDVISKSILHIDTDSGLAHAATAMGVPCVVLFGPTPKEFYGHPQNQNVSRETSCRGGCFHLTQNWMDKCPAGYQTPQCMDDIEPADVLVAVEKCLASHVS
jgi:hypothetical protein